MSHVPAFVWLACAGFSLDRKDEPFLFALMKSFCIEDKTRSQVSSPFMTLVSVCQSDFLGKGDICFGRMVSMRLYHFCTYNA